MKMVMTNHAMIDRADRIGAIVDYLKGDLGEVVITAAGRQKGLKQELTSNGVLIVRTIDNVLVTMYLCSIKQAQWFERTANKYLTRNQWQRINANQRHKELINAA